MIKNLLIGAISILCLSISCSPQIIRNSNPTEKSHFGITSPSKAIFFVENEKMETDEKQLEIHTKRANEIYNKFGQITDKIMVGRTNAKTFKFSKRKKTWLVDVNLMPKRTAMILFDGKRKPMIEYDVENYLPMVNQYLSDDLKKNQTLSKTISTERKTAKTKVDSLWSISFEPDKKYASEIIRNLKRYYSPAIFGFSFTGCDGTIFTQVFTDLAETQLSYTSSITYENGKLINDEYIRDKQVSGQKRFFNSLGLLESIVYHSDNKKYGEYHFKYLPDRIISRYNDNQSRDEYLLNDKFQIVKKLSFDERNILESEYHFSYDNLNRLISETGYRSGKKDRTLFYEYENEEQKQFSKMKIVDENGNNAFENINTIIDGKKTFISMNHGKIQSKTVNLMNENCEGKVLMYDSYNAITGVTVQSKK